VTRIHSLDLVRGSAACAVAIAHYLIALRVAPRQSEVASILAVEVFFVLSGFVLAPQILLCLKERRWRITRTFLARRWLRTIPPYVVALVCATVVFQSHASWDTLRYLSYTQNLLGQHNTNDYFAVAWSLSVEEWFYVVFPVVLLAGVRVPRVRNIVRCCLMFVAVIFVLRLVFADLMTWGPSVRRVVIFRIDAIVYGFLLQLAMTHVPGFRKPIVAIVLAPVLLVLSALVVEPASAGNPLAAQAFPFLAAAFGGSIVALGLAAQPVVDRWGLGPLAVFAGRISYSVYLFHTILVALLLQLAPALPFASHFLLYVALLVMFGAAFYRFFEAPILDGRPSYQLARDSAGLASHASA